MEGRVTDRFEKLRNYVRVGNQQTRGESQRHADRHKITRAERLSVTTCLHLSAGIYAGISQPSVDRMSDFHNVVMQARNGDLTIDEIAQLATQLASSGAILHLGDARTADLASTGGPTSLSTILCPPMLVSAGWTVAKLGVPGRPAGGVDVLGTIPGYEVAISVARAETILATCGYVHVDAGKVFAPADAAFFRYRQSVDAQAVPDLAIASLLSKKLAMGLKRVGLEVRVAPHGNFGADRAAARENAFRFCQVGSALGLDTVCILTDATRPFQPYVGRGEALLALKEVLDGSEGDWLGDHLADCAMMSTLVAGLSISEIDRAAVAAAARANILAQGGSMEALEARAAQVMRESSRSIEAPVGGYLEYDLGVLRSAVLAAQGARPDSWPDNAGVTLIARPGERIEPRQKVMIARCPDHAWPAMSAALAAALRIGHRRETSASAVLEVVGD